jgi:hypothetical protein
MFSEESPQSFAASVIAMDKFHNGREPTKADEMIERP